MTIYAKCIQDGDKFELVEWKPWINCKLEDIATLPRLILHRWVRDRGGIGEQERLSVTVYTFDEETPRYPNGKPKQCQSTTYKIEPK
jgi:hypothetical protein